MNNDITFCTNVYCAMRMDCYRAQHPKDGIHSYSDFFTMCRYPDYKMMIKIIENFMEDIKEENIN